ncbi:Glucose repression regulatory protein TUP1 [Phytophthora palmivora]|uniref:Glucose repression regulatory protein TUP1 n=1 Tax=Phytophthora palmivora TaxID=4796 RepID=A0A2P4WYW8_9STRA|nr:Glucose repression regulatory protein TUP1 [Phytophthora palmivora]
MELAWVLALLLMLAGAGYMYMQHQEETRRQALKLQKEKEELARQQFHALNYKKPKSKAKKKVDVTAELKKKKTQTAAEDAGDEHSSIMHVIKGHKYGITAAAYSPNGRFLATASSDRSIRLYFRETLKDKNPKLHQINIEYDHVTAMCFSSDGRSLVVATENATVKVYQKLRAKPEIVADFPISHKTDVHSVLMNDIGNWATIITCASDSDTDVKFWNLSGELLQTVNTNQVANYHCIGSKDNRYIAVAAYTPEVKIYEIAREKSGAFKKVNKIMTLQGHRTGVMDLAFDGSDALPVNRVVTISKDASVRLWDINVRYTVQEDPKVMSAFTASGDLPFQAVDFAPNGKILAMVRGKDLEFIRTSDNNAFCTIEDAIEDPIKRAVFSPDGSEVLVLGKNCKHAKIYKTPDL